MSVADFDRQACRDRLKQVAGLHAALAVLTLYGVLNCGLPSQQAIDQPNFTSLNGPTLLEEIRFAPATVEALRTRGAEVRELPMTSGLQAFTRGDIHGQPMWLGGPDPRREGVVMGD